MWSSPTATSTGTVTAGSRCVMPSTAAGICVATPRSPRTGDPGSPVWSPPSAVHDLVEGASVQPLDDGQRLVRRIADGEHVGQESSVGEAQNGPGLVLVGDRGMAGADAQDGRGGGPRISGLAKGV